MKTIARLWLLSLVWLYPWYALAQEAPEASRRVEGRLDSGASYVVDLPANWNGTLLLFSHGYARGPDNPPRNVAGREKDWLLAHGYALIGSSYASPGWALEQAVPDQIATLDAFAKQFGKPKRTIAWGSSMGGLVTIALTERHPERIDGSLVLCASAAGTVGMMNEALDGAFAFKTLLAPGSDLPVLFNAQGEQFKQQMAAWKRQLDQAQARPEGRARIALAATLAQIPPWIAPNSTRPAADDFTAQQTQLYLGLLGGTLLPRDDQERRAGGNFSWNAGIDYGAQLARSGREAFVRSLYDQAGIRLEQDLAALGAAPRVAARPEAVRYMKQNYAPSGRLLKPMLLMQAIADPVTLVELSGDYARLVRQAGHGELLREAYVERSGHCNFSRAETLAALLAVERRVERGSWGEAAPETSSAAAINAAAASLGLDGSSFIDYRPAPFLRSCSTREAYCAGETQPRVSAPGRYSGYAAAAYSDYVRSSQYVAGADGTRLALDIYRPANGEKLAQEKLPVILLHFTSPRRNPDAGKHAARMEQIGLGDLLRSGYVVAWMEPRGVGASFGASNGFITPRMGADVDRVIEWLATQPWSTGKVAMLGISNGGLIQSMAAAGAPPHLAALAPGVANPNFYYQLYPNGASAVGGAGSPAARAAAASAPPAEGAPVDEDNAPDHPLLKAATAEHAGNFGMGAEWLPNMFRDSFNPKVGYAPGLAASPIEAAAQIKAAKLRIYQMGGWFDSSPGGQLVAYKLWGDKIIVGSWLHNILGEDQGGPLLSVEHRRWFDQVLKGIDNGILDEPPVYYHTIHATPEAEWRFAADWPIPTQRSTAFYFAAGRSNTVASANDGILLTRKPKGGSAKDSYQVDYDIAAFDGKFNRLGRSWSGDMAPGVDAKGLTYTTAPLPADTEMTGHPVAHLWVTSSAPDGNFVLYIEEVDGSGKSLYVTDGVIRAGHRKLKERSPWKEMGLPYHRSLEADYAPLSATQAVELAFDFNPISYVFRKGNRIRITVTGAEKTTYQLPPGADPKAPPTISLHRDGRYASYVTLPLVPAKSSRYAGAAAVNTAALRYAGPAEFYPSAATSYLRLGDSWIKCAASAAAKAAPRRTYACSSRIGRLRIDSEGAGATLRVRGEGVRFTGRGF